MTEIVLNYERAVAPQERYYWCGPASTQMILNARGIIRSEQDLANEIGTTVNGTDYVGLIERVLDRYLPDAHYTSVYLERDPATEAQREGLWRHIIRSITAGYGVSCNIVAPPSNYPRGVKGSPNPAYAGGTIFHYVAAMGFSDEGGRFVWIADSGFRPFGYWMTFDQLATLIPPKGYAYADADPVAAPSDDSVEAVMTTNQQRLTEVHDKILAYPDVPEIAGHWPSRARCRRSNAGVDDTVGMVLYSDANIYDLLTAWSAVTVGDPASVRIIDDGAAGKLPANDPDSLSWFKSVAKAIKR